MDHIVLRNIKILSFLQKKTQETERQHKTVFTVFKILSESYVILREILMRSLSLYFALCDTNTITSSLAKL
jgi:hypothetical protein